jgi:hypothetical protein
VSAADRAVLREQWEGLVAQYRKVASRLTWLYENQEDPEWAERDAATGRSDAILAAQMQEVLEWSGAEAGEILEMLTRCGAAA